VPHNLVCIQVSLLGQFYAMLDQLDDCYLCNQRKNTVIKYQKLTGLGKTLANALHFDCMILADKYHRKNKTITSFNLPIETQAKNQPLLAIRQLRNDTRQEYYAYFLLMCCVLNAYFAFSVNMTKKPNPTMVKPKIQVLNNQSLKTHNFKYSHSIKTEGMGWGECIVGKEEKPGPHSPISFHHMGIFPNFTQQRPYTKKADGNYNNGYSYLLTEAKKTNDWTENRKDAFKRVTKPPSQSGTNGKQWREGLTCPFALR
jgi:hypothetical protein